MSKYKRSGRPQSSRWKRTTRPRLEVLESRLVLSTISGTVFNDLHVTGAIAADDPGLANRTVFVDLHNDGVQHSDDPSAVTDASGHYVITGVNPGTLRVVTYSGDNPTTPTAVVINANSSTANFGLQPESTILPTTPNPAPFAGGGNAVVEGLYRNILGRDADPAGLANWDAQLKAGESATQVANQFFQSSEYLTDVVKSYYQTYLGRAGDPAGVASWVAKLQAGASEEEVAAAFLSSPEYSAKHVTDGDFVQSLYENILGRDGDPAGINNWTQLLGAGTSRGVVAASFIGSPESYQRAIDGDYNVFLARVGDTSGVNSWVAQVQNGSMTLAEVAALFAGSPEYATRASQETAPATPTAIPVISFHGISNVGPYDVPLSTFTADMTALHDAGYHSITLQQYLDWEAGKNPVLPSKPILLTDDDGDASIQQMTSVLQSDGYTMVAFIVTGFIDNSNTFNVTWAQLQSMVASGTWEVAFHAGADGHYDYATGPPPGQQIEPNAPDFYADYFTANNGGVLETDAQYQARVTTELDQGMARLKQMIPTAYTNVFTPPSNDYGESAPDSPGGPQQQDLTTIFDARFTLVFVEDNNYPNSVDNNHHEYRFEVHSDTSTSTLLAALNDPAFTRFGLTALTPNLVVTTPPPTSVTAGVPFSLVVTAEDSSGNVDSTYTSPVTLALFGGTSGAVLGGTLTVNAVNGVAAFTGLTINTAGTSYTLTASSGTLTSAKSSINVAAATAAPSITGLSTINGPAAGGTTVTIYGTNFTGATAVQFGTVNATSYTVDSTGTVITAVSPAGTANTYPYITVTTPQGTSPDSVAYTFEYVAATTGAPSVTGLSPPTAPPRAAPR